MNELWRKRTYPIQFQLCTTSKLDRVELYGTFGDHHWKESFAQLTYAHQNNSGQYIYSAIVDLIPGEYEYKYRVNQKDWKMNSTIKIRKENNVLSKEDFIEMIIDRYDTLDKKERNDQTCYHDVASILYRDHIMYDFKLIVNQNQEFKVHRAILAAGSELLGFDVHESSTYVYSYQLRLTFTRINLDIYRDRENNR